MTTTHTQPAGCNLDSLRDLIANDGFAMSFQSMGQYRAALIAAARAAQAPQVAQHAETIEQYVPPQAEILADEAKLYRDLTGDAMALGFDGVPAALEALRTVRSQAPQGAAIALPVDLIHDFRDAIAVARHRAKHDGDTASKKRWIEVASRLDGYARSIATPAAHTCTPADERADAPVTYMNDEQAFKWAWNTLKKDLGADRWTVGDEVQSWAFFKYGWDYKTQYMKQARAAQGAGTAPVDGSFEDLRNVLEMVRQSMALSRFEKARGQVNHAIFLLKSLVATPPALAAQGAGTAPILAPCEGGPILSDSCSDCRREGGLCELVATPPAPVSTAPSKSPEFEGIGDAPVSTAAATTASASGGDTSRNLAQRFRAIAEDWPSFTFSPVSKEELLAAADAMDATPSRAADGQQATTASASIDTAEFRRLSFAYAEALFKGTVPQTSAAWAALVEHVDNRAPTRAADGQQGASRAVLDEPMLRDIVTKSREFYLGYLSRHIPGDDIDAVRAKVTTDTACRAIAFDLRAAQSRAQSDTTGDH